MVKFNQFCTFPGRPGLQLHRLVSSIGLIDWLHRLVVPHHSHISCVIWYYSCNGLPISGWIATVRDMPSTAFINIFILYPIDPEDLVNNSHVPASLSSGSYTPHGLNRSLAHSYSIFFSFPELIPVLRPGLFL